MTTYYCRHDGTAANKAAATDPTSASTAMSLATHNAETFSPNDEIILSSRGGVFDGTRLIPPSAGSSGNPISYRMETGYETYITQVAAEGTVTAQTSYVHFYGIDARQTTSPWLLQGSAVGIETHDCIARDSGNQCIQHLNTVQADHYNLTAHDGDDECLSCHDNCIVRVFGGHFYDGATTCANWVGTGTLEFHDVLFESMTGTRCIQVSGGLDLKFYRCYLKENASISRALDCGEYAGPLVFENCIFDLGTTAGDFYLLARSGRTDVRIANCLFYGGLQTNSVVFNQDATSDCRNNIFLNTNGKNYSATTGVDYNCFHNAGTAKGANSITTDPLLIDPSGGNFRLSKNSPCRIAGANLSAVLDEPNDYANLPRSLPWDIGPYKASAVPKIAQYYRQMSRT